RAAPSPWRRGARAARGRGPRLAVRVRPRRPRRGLDLRAGVRSDERATLRARLVPSPARARTARLAPRRTMTMTFPTAPRARTAQLRLVATDAAGNARRLTRRVTIHPARRVGRR